MHTDIVGQSAFIKYLRASILAASIASGVSGMPPSVVILRAQNIAPPVSADTELLTVGHRDFRRYDTPGWCQAAGGWTANIVRGTIEAEAVLDTVRPWQDTLGAANVAAVTRACGARFTVAATDVALLPTLFDLALQEQADSLAGAVVTRFAQSHHDIQWMPVLKGYLTARPPRFTAAEALVAQWDAPGSAAPLALRMEAHGELLTFWETRGDSARSRTEAERLVRLGQTAPDTLRERLLRSGAPLWHAYAVLTTLAFLAHPAVTIDSAIHAQYAAIGGKDPLTPSAAFGDPVQAQWEQLEPINSWRHDGWEWRRAHTYTPFPPWHPTYWFPATAAQQPLTPSRVNLYVIYGGRWRGNAALVARIRRWLAQYQAQGLVVTFVARTSGFAQALSSSNQPFGPWPRAEEEARDLASYVQHDEHLPVAVAVTETPMHWRASPDGRRIVDDTIQFAGSNIESDVWPRLVLVGRRGQFLDEEKMREDMNPTFEALLGWAIAQPPAVAHR